VTRSLLTWPIFSEVQEELVALLSQLPDAVICLVFLVESVEEFMTVVLDLV